MSVKTIKVVWREDGSATVLGRVTARDGTGASTGVPGEGKFMKQADFSTISYAAYDLNSATPMTAVASGNLTIADVILDTPVTTTFLWTLDNYGYNFIHDVSSSVFSTADHLYRLEYKFTSTGSGVGWGVYEGPAEGVFTS